MKRQLIGCYLILMLAFWFLATLPQSHAQQPTAIHATSIPSGPPGPGQDLPVDPGLGGCELDYITEVQMGLNRFCSDDALGSLICNIGDALQNKPRSELKTLCDEYKRKFLDNPISLPLYGVDIPIGTLCDLLVGLDEEGNGVFSKRVYYHGKDYGEIGNQSAFDRALKDHIGELKRCSPTITSWPEGYEEELSGYGKFYCTVKAQSPGGSAVADVMQEASKQFHSRAKFQSADAMMQRDAIAVIAEHTLCPSGHLNPVPP